MPRVTPLLDALLCASILDSAWRKHPMCAVSLLMVGLFAKSTQRLPWFLLLQIAVSSGVRSRP